MENRSKTNIVSFIIRFVQDQTEIDAGSHAYRGAIRHIQTNEEIQFADWEDAVTFIRQYISIDQTPKKLSNKGDNHAYGR
jgi:hypothetical protein